MKKANDDTSPILYSHSFLFGISIRSFNFRKRAGKMIGNGQTKVDSANLARAVSTKVLLLAFLIFAGVFVITHLFPMPYGAKAVQSALGGLPLFDKQPSFSIEEVYSRLQAYSSDGFNDYKRFTYTVDLIFPLAFFYFLVTLSRFVVERISLSNFLTKAIIALPFIWLGFDLLENSMVFTLLSGFPNRIDFLAGILGFVTAAKFGLLLLSILVPPVFLVFGKKS